MKLFGTVHSFDSSKRSGMIKPEAGGDAVAFEGGAFKWVNNAQPVTDQRLSYELGKGADGAPRAVNLQTI
jgi:cold shock protein